MKKAAALIVSIFLMTCAGSAYAGDAGTKDEAVAMVKKAIAYIKANGRDKALAEFNNTKGSFIDRDLYVTVYDFEGNCLAHGMKPNMVGKNLLGMKDADGKAHIKERVDMMKKQDTGWQNFKFMNPLTKQIEPKTMYCERFGDIIVACGVYNK